VTGAFHDGAYTSISLALALLQGSAYLSRSISSLSGEFLVLSFARRILGTHVVVRHICWTAVCIAHRVLHLAARTPCFLPLEQQPILALNTSSFMFSACLNCGGPSHAISSSPGNLGRRPVSCPHANSLCRCMYALPYLSHGRSTLW